MINSFIDVLAIYIISWARTRLAKWRWRRRRRRKLLLKFNVDECNNRRICNSLESCSGQNYGGTINWWQRRCCSNIINDPNLNRLALNTGARLRSTDAPHQVLPPTRRPIVPYSVAGCRKQVARRELRWVAPITLSGYIYRYICIYRLMRKLSWET